MNVKVKHFTEPTDRKALLAGKDFNEGDVIYTVGVHYFLVFTYSLFSGTADGFCTRSRPAVFRDTLHTLSACG
jgi:hypothetical protein